jgi:hypothetical protein
MYHYMSLLIYEQCVIVGSFATCRYARGAQIYLDYSRVEVSCAVGVALAALGRVGEAEEEQRAFYRAVAIYNWYSLSDFVLAGESSITGPNDVEQPHVGSK